VVDVAGAVLPASRPSGTLKLLARPADALAVEHRRQRVLVETTRHRIAGTVHLARDGYRSRISDLLNASDREFLALTDAVVEPLGPGQEPERHEFLAVQRRHVVLVAPLADAA
jgi:hypothetical protein